MNQRFALLKVFSAVVASVFLIAACEEGSYGTDAAAKKPNATDTSATPGGGTTSSTGAGHSPMVGTGPEAGTGNVEAPTPGTEGTPLSVETTSDQPAAAATPPAPDMSSGNAGLAGSSGASGNVDDSVVPVPGAASGVPGRGMNETPPADAGDSGTTGSGTKR